ncbi:hypothetical protein QMK33_17135 [Hymenobacter sp. H14-R3]|uniref:hypothetical protein n=1 Tax=Hymenobacter sp. H14-R3 TaxID=3046308 RepID=UPI0024BB242A|nr:hypothetical protein [Hymenobacter sp. H14-R3]MDJ0366878.1 hypothetical protein [Hymenobacter sp. H14-R3]
MSFIYQLGLLTLLAAPVAAQEIAPAVAPRPPAVRLPPTSFKSGTYQLHNSRDWQRAKLLYDAHSLSVSNADHTTQYPLVYPTDSVRAFVISRDTFSVVREVDIPRPTQHFPSLIVRHLYWQAGFQVAEYVSVMPAPEPPVVYILLTQAGKLKAVLPPNNLQFRLALSKALSDYPTLSHQLELDPNIMPEQLPQLLTAYGSWKNAGGK